MGQLDQIIRTEISKLSEGFAPNELAYLAGTGKVEHCLRDRLAFRLQELLGDKNEIVMAREWRKPRTKKRVDLAVFQDGKTIALLEFTAMCTFDGVQKTANQLMEKVVEDLKKLKAIAKPGTKLYSVLFVIHLTRMPEHLQGILKYVPKVNKALDKYKSSQNLFKTCAKKVMNYLQGRKLQGRKLRVSCIAPLDGGEWFGVRSKIACWVVHYTVPIARRP